MSVRFCCLILFSAFWSLSIQAQSNVYAPYSRIFPQADALLAENKSQLGADLKTHSGSKCMRERQFLSAVPGARAPVLNRYLETPSPREKSDYQDFLQVINRLRMSEMAQAGFYYMDHHRELLNQHEPGWAVYTRLAEACGKSEVAHTAQQTYTMLFPQGTTLKNIQP